MKALQDMILEMELPMAPLWMEALELGTINVFVALILSQLINLQTLHLDVDFFMGTKRYNQIMGALAASLLFLLSLTSDFLLRIA